jgi:hypothetical protein
MLGAAERRQHFAWQIESLGQNADDLEPLAIQRDRPADDRRIAAVPALPHAVAEHCLQRRPGDIVAAVEHTPGCRAHPQHRQQAG